MTILSNSDEWRVYPEELAKRCRDSVDAVRTQLKALEKAGYIRSYRKSLGGRYGTETHRFCSDTKISDEVFQELLKELIANVQIANVQIANVQIANVQIANVQIA
ncbi:helix-turn-helix domain-containing protein [Streptococcus equi subsp. zooepidemicus]|nr:helix-turn-helix domain-containing protein [Streptococcus equi subsp. zooepidemicus]